MDEPVVLAILGVAGVVAPVIFSKRFGKWRTLDLLQQETNVYNALPESMDTEREALGKAIAQSVKSYEEQRFAAVSTNTVLLVTWVFWVFALFLFTVLTKGAGNRDAWVAPLTGIGWGADITAFVGAVGFSLVLVLVGLVRLAGRYRWAKRVFGPWLTGPVLRLLKRGIGPNADSLTANPSDEQGR
jgi:hypothetical protein